MGGLSLVPLGELDAASMDALGELHASQMPTSALSRLGPSITRRFYRSILASDHLFGAAAIEDGRIEGAVVGTGRPNDAFDGIAKPLPRFALEVLLRRPGMFAQLAWSKLFPAHDVARPEGSAELLYVFTRQEARGRGLGKRLTDSFLETARARGFRAVTLSVEIDNEGAIGMYTRRGFVIVAERQREGGHLCHRMSAPL